MHDWKRLVRERLAGLSGDPLRELEIVEEIAQDLEDRHRSARLRGGSEEEAFREAMAELDQVAAARSEFERPHNAGRAAPLPPATGRGFWGPLLQDARYALRLLARRPGFHLFAVSILALGIGAVTSVFSVVNAVLLKPPPFVRPGEILVVGHASGDGTPGNVGFETLADWRRATSLEAVSAVRSWSPTLAREDGAERLSGLRVSHGFFSLLGVRPALGRDFRESDDRPGQNRSVIVSDLFWKSRLGGDRSPLGRSLELNGARYEVVGVLPAGFDNVVSSHFYQPAEIWAPLGYDSSQSWACRSCQHLKALARLRAGASLESARAELNTIHDGLRGGHPGDYGEEGVAADRLHDSLTRSVRPALGVLSGAVALVLLIGCANVANMLLVRSLQRGKEMDVRRALGADPRRLFRQLLTEAFCLGAAAAILGVGLAALAVRALESLAPGQSLGVAAFPLDGRVALFACGVSIIVSLLFGMAPALHASCRKALPSVGAGGRNTAPPRVQRLQRALVAGNLALALLLLSGSLLMLQTVQRLLAVDPGFNPKDLLSFKISMLGDRYEEPERVQAALEEILSGLESLPGSPKVAAASQIPFGGNWDSWGFHIQDKPFENPAEAPSVQRYSVTPGYFGLMGIVLRRGRLFSSRDRRDAPPVVIIGETTAKTLWPGEDPIGAEVRIGGGAQPWRTVVGIVNDVRHRDLSAPPGMSMYLPMTQWTDSYLTVAVRTAGDPSTLIPLARKTLAGVAGDIPLYDAALVGEMVSRTAADRLYVSLLLSVFAALAALLTTAGIYGVASHYLAQRSRELGIRVALGAGRPQIVRLVLGGGLRVAAPGMALGLILALLLSESLESLLFGIEPLDPATLLACTLLTLLIVVAAHLPPLRSALRVDPTQVLRAE